MMPAPQWLNDRGVAWLVAKGYAIPTDEGYDLTQDGRDWLLWALWIRLGCPGMPEATYQR